MFEHDKSPSESEASPKMPVLTVIATILVLFVFAGLVGLTYYYGKDLSSKPVGENGADQLRELRAQEQAILTSYRYNEPTKSWQIPITSAMDALVREGETKGKWETFPKASVPTKK